MSFSPPVRSVASAQTAGESIRVIGLFPDLLGLGGLQESGRLTSAAITAIVSRRGGEAAFLSLNDSRGPKEFDLEGIRVPLKGFGRGKVRFVLSALSRSYLSAKDMQGIVVAAHPHLAVPAGWMRRLAPRLKTAVMAHGIEVWNALPAPRRHALQRANVVLAPSRYTAEKLHDSQGLAHERIRVVPWPLNPEFARMACDPSKLPLPENFPEGRILLTVGRWVASERYKGADDLIRALARLRPNYPDLQVVAVGDGDDVPRLGALAISLGVANSVHFLAGLTRPQIAACYSRAELFALPSTGEGFGLVFLEAMAFGKPVIGVSTGGVLDLIQDGVNGMLLPPHDLSKLVDAIEMLLRDDSLRGRMGHAGAELVRGKYSFETFKHHIEQIIDELISAPGN